MSRRETLSTDAETRAPAPPVREACFAALAAFGLYVLTLAPTTGFWDASEYIATAHIVGIPHPPGNPLFVMVAKAWSLLLAPTGLSVAIRINLFAATTSAAATGCFYLVAHRVLSGFLTHGLARIGAGASALVGATTFTVWNQSNVNEKVYTLSVLVIALVSWLAVRWYDRREETGSERLLLWCIFLIALGSTSHMMSVLPAPALGVLVLMAGARRLLTVDFLGRAVLLGLLGLSFSFVLPVRAAQNPVINEADPTCETVTETALAVFTGGRQGCDALGASLRREQYQAPPVTQRKAPFGAQFATYVQYFEWQWSRGLDPSELPSPARLPFTLLFFVLGVTGLYAAWRTDRAIFSYLAVLAVTLTVALVYYLNFRYGYSLASELDQAQREVRERDYFFVAGFMLWGSLAGMGLVWAWDALARGLGGGLAKYRLAAPVLVVAFLPMAFNWAWATRAGDYAARDWAYDLLTSVEPYGILFTNGDNDTFPLWYLQEVEGIRKDVTVIVGQYLFTSWYPKQLLDLTMPGNQRLFDPDAIPGLYEDREPPTLPLTSLTPDVMDGVTAVQLPQDITIAFPQLAVTYPAGMILDRGQQLALRFINDNEGERPIFFSSSAGLMSELGLDRWGVRYGLTTKLVLRNIESDSTAAYVQGTPEYGAEWFDIDKTLALYDDVYQYRGIRDRPIWPDRSTLMIPWQYYVLAVQLSNAVEIAGLDPALSARFQEDAEAFQLVAQGGILGTPGLIQP